MCGIVGAIVKQTSKHNVVPILLKGLSCLQYRGYDSAGIVVINAQQQLERQRTLGKISVLEQRLKKNLLIGTIGIAHTRWATHGKPSENNAHPHVSNDNEIAVVHNGIIENYQTLRQSLLAEGYQFSSETDTEVIAHLLQQQMQITPDFYQAVQAMVKKLQGAFAIAFLCRRQANQLIAVRQGSPLVIGIGDDENYLASDHLALLPVTRRLIYLEEGEIAQLDSDQISIVDKKGRAVSRSIHQSQLNKNVVDKGNWRHFMQKEIFEQPYAIQCALEGRLEPQSLCDRTARNLFKTIKRIQIVGCGTSYHAGLIGRYWFENLANIPCYVDIASEIRYRSPLIDPDTLLITLSQSGETADTLNALRAAKKQPYLGSMAICNVAESTLIRESDIALLTRAGPEIGVASTKAFTAQLVALILLALELAEYRQIQPELTAHWRSALRNLPKCIDSALALDSEIRSLAESFVDKQHALFIARTIYFPVALEGALKLQEISYIHASAYPAGELKHGPLALVSKGMPVIVLAAPDPLSEKLKSNIQEVYARSGQLIIFSDEQFTFDAYHDVKRIHVPVADPILNPFLYTIPLQLLAYHVAVLKGTDVDQPRNLAKSVTVE